MRPPDIRCEPQRSGLMFGRFSARLIVSLLVMCTLVFLYDLSLLIVAR